MNAIYDRRSIRKFQNTAISRETIIAVIEAGRAAPSAKNRQPWKYIVFANSSKRDLLDKMEIGLNREENIYPALPKSKFGLADAKSTLKVMYEAPVIILVLNTNGTSPFIPLDADARITEICDTLSIGASIQNILLKAHEIGLGTLWIANTCFAYKELAEYLKIDCQLIGAIALGYAGECPHQRPRKNIEEIMEFRF